MPDPLSLLRLVGLVIFIALVAVGLWLLDVAWWVVPPVMAGALLIAWAIEWLAWRGTVGSSVVSGTEFPEDLLPPVEEELEAPAPGLPPLAAPEPEAVTPPAPERPPRSPAPEPEAEPEPEPTPEPEPEAEPGLEVPREPEAQPDRVPAPEPRSAPEPEPEPEPQREPAREPEPAQPPEPEPSQPAPVAGEESVPPVRIPERIAPPRRPRRFRLRSVPGERREEPAPEPETAPAPMPRETAPVVDFRPRTTEPQQWNIWDLERIAREEAGEHPERRDEWSYLFVHLRQFARADGALPAEFDPLVRESFGGLLERVPRV